MSHFTSVKTKIRDLVCLERALKDLDYVFSKSENEQLVTVRGYQGETTDAVLSIHASNGGRVESPFASMFTVMEPGAGIRSG